MSSFYRHQNLKLRWVLLTTLLIFTIAIPSGLMRPKQSEALVITLTVGAIALIKVIAVSMAIGAATGMTTHLIREGFPESGEDWALFGLDTVDGALVGGLYGTAAGGFGRIAQLAVQPGINQLLVFHAITQGTDIVGTSVEVNNAIRDVKDKQAIVIEEGINDFFADNPNMTEEELKIVIQNPEEHFIPYIEANANYNNFTQAVDNFIEVVGDELEQQGLSRNVWQEFSMLSSAAILEATTSGPITDIDENSVVKIRHSINPEYLSLEDRTDNIAIGFEWKIYNYISQTWNHLDQKGYVHQGSSWYGPVDFQSKSILGSELLEISGLESGDSRPVLISTSWIVTQGTETVHEVDMSQYAPQSGVVNDTPLLFSLKISPPTQIGLLSPNGSEIWEIGSSQNIVWESSGDVGAYVNIDISRDGGNSWDNLFSNTPNDGTETWNVNGVESNNCSIRIFDTSNSEIVGTSHASFSILPTCSDHDIKVSFVETNNSSIEPDQTVQISGNITNSGENSDTIDVLLQVTGPNGYNCNMSKTVTLSGGSNMTTIQTFNWPSTCSTPSATGYYAATISALSSYGCDKTSADNYGSADIYVSETGSGPPVKAYRFRKYFLDYNGSEPGGSVTVGSKTFTLEANGIANISEDNAEYKLTITGEGTKWYDDYEYSYTSADNQYIWWQHKFYPGSLALIIGQADNANGFNDYRQMVTQGDTAVFTSPVDYDSSYIFTTTGDPESGIRVNFSNTNPLGGFSTAPNDDLLVDSSGLGQGSYKFAILTDEPDSGHDDYIALGQFDVILPTHKLSIQKSGNGNGQVLIDGVTYNLPYDGHVNSGQVVNLEAVASSGSVFESWSGASNSTSSSLALTMNGDKALIANFSYPDFTISMNPDPTFVELYQGEVANYTISVGAIDAFSSTVILSAVSDVCDVSDAVTFSQNSIVPPFISTFTIDSSKIDNSMVLMSIPITIGANGNDKWHHAEMELKVYPPEPDIAVSDNSLVFGSTYVGANLTRALVISNNGTDTLLVNNLGITEGVAYEFAIDNLAGPFSLEPGENKTIEVRFSPESFGSKASFLKIYSNDPDQSVKDVTLLGYAIGPEIEVNKRNFAFIDNTGNFNFGSVFVGSEKVEGFSIRNIGNADMILSGESTVEVTGTNAAEFIVLQQPASLVHEKDTTFFTVSFNPISPGEKIAIVSIANNDYNENSIEFEILGKGSIASGDVNGDGKIDIGDSISSLKVTSDATVNNSPYVEADVNGDNSIGAIESIAAMQMSAALRPVGEYHYVSSTGSIGN